MRPTGQTGDEAALGDGNIGGYKLNIGLLQFLGMEIDLRSCAVRLADKSQIGANR
jgi:hypothetical protein